MKFRVLTLFLASSLLLACSSDDDSSTTDDMMEEVADEMTDENPDEMPDEDPDETPDEDPDETPDEVLITYVDDVEPIFNSNCVSCHGPVTANGGIDLSTFDLAVLWSDQANAAMISRRMPLGGNLPQETIDVIGQWIEDGLLENN